MNSTKIAVDRKGTIQLSEEFTRSNGSYKTSPFNRNLLSSEIKSFLVSDLELVDCPDINISGTDFAKHVNGLNLVPLDEFCARAILEHKSLTAILENLLSKGGFFVRKDFDLKSINFFGSLATNGKDHDFIYCLQFNGVKSQPEFMVFENQPPAWQRGKDFALVLNKYATKKLITEINLRKKAEEKQKK